MTKVLLTRKEASTYLSEQGVSRSVATLAKYATVGGGPKYHKFGKAQVLYSTDDLDAWISEQLSEAVSSSSEFLA